MGDRLICTDCRQPFDHMIVHRRDPKKKFCDDCLRAHARERSRKANGRRKL